MTNIESERTRTPRDGNSRAASSPAITARYSATLFVVTPMRSLTAASGDAGSEGSKTTAPIAAGPGLPRAPPSHATTNHSLIFFRSWRGAPTRSGPAPLRAGIPGSRPLRSRHHQDAATVVAGRDRARRRAPDPVGFDRGNRQVTPLTRVADETSGTDASRPGSPLLVLGEQL